jgi:hypothetical protein
VFFQISGTFLGSNQIDFASCLIISLRWRRWQEQKKVAGGGETAVFVIRCQKGSAVHRSFLPDFLSKGLMDCSSLP